MAYLRVKAESWTSNLMCRIFGHKISGYNHGVPYGRKGSWSELDGVGVHHVPIVARCGRCEEKVTVIKIHEIQK